jgi:hypothetical protein
VKVATNKVRVQQNKGMQEKYNKKKNKVYIQEYRNEECGVFYLLYY